MMLFTDRVQGMFSILRKLRRNKVMSYNDVKKEVPICFLDGTTDENYAIIIQELCWLGLIEVTTNQDGSYNTLLW